VPVSSGPSGSFILPSAGMSQQQQQQQHVQQDVYSNLASGFVSSPSAPVPGLVRCWVGPSATKPHSSEVTRAIPGQPIPPGCSEHFLPAAVLSPSAGERGVCVCVCVCVSGGG
jgi:hypothetical protein